MENNPQKNWFSRHMLLGYLFLGLVFAAIVVGVFWMENRGGVIVTKFPRDNSEDRCEEKDEEAYKNLAPAKIEKSDETHILTLQCEEVKSVYVANSAVKLEPFVDRAVDVKYKYVEYLNSNVRCIQAPCDAAMETRVEILEISVATNDSGSNLINSFAGCAVAGYPIMESYPEKCKTSDGLIFVKPIGACIQVIQDAKNPETGEIRAFATPCDVPLGWEKVN